MKMKEMEIVKLKEDSKKMSKDFIQRKVEDQVPPSLVKVHIFVVKCYSLFEFTVYVAARDAPIIRSTISVSFLYRIGMCSKLLADLIYLLGNTMLLVIAFLGGQVVARKPYLIQILRLSLVL